MKTKNDYLELAETLVEMEVETAESYVMDWNEEYGTDCNKLLDDVMVDHYDTLKLADMIKEDHESGMWTADEYGGIFSPEMREQYGGWLEHCVKKQIALLSGTGYQMVINLN